MRPVYSGQFVKLFYDSGFKPVIEIQDTLALTPEGALTLHDEIERAMDKMTEIRLANAQDVVDLYRSEYALRSDFV